MYFPFKKVDGMMAKVSVLFLFPLWAVWVGWKNRIDLIIAFGPLYAFIQALSKIILKRPMVTFIRGNMSFGSKMQNSSRTVLYFMKYIENIGIRCSNRIITNNEASRSEILRKEVDVQVLYNNIPPMNISNSEDISGTRRKYGIPENAKVLVTAGILNRGKNIETLIDCLPKISRKAIFLLIAGEGSTETDYHYINFLKGLVVKLRVDQQVVFTGWLQKQELWKIYQASDLFVLPSLNEGMPNAMIEALACQLPCFGSDIPGVRDILHYEELLFDPEYAGIISNKIEQFLYDEQYANHVTQLCHERKRIFVFDWKERMYLGATKGITF
jgi:glycosyltransferase involved in cell wall biosynthesis